jgi:hypothetical protein
MLRGGPIAVVVSAVAPGPVPEGWRVITVWESREAFERFREESLLPAIRASPAARAPGGQPVRVLITA